MDEVLSHGVDEVIEFVAVYLLGIAADRERRLREKLHIDRRQGAVEVALPAVVHHADGLDVLLHIVERRDRYGLLAEVDLGGADDGLLVGTRGGLGAEALADGADELLGLVVLAVEGRVGDIAYALALAALLRGHLPALREEVAHHGGLQVGVFAYGFIQARQHGVDAALVEAVLLHGAEILPARADEGQVAEAVGYDLIAEGYPGVGLLDVGYDVLRRDHVVAVCLHAAAHTGGALLAVCGAEDGVLMLHMVYDLIGVKDDREGAHVVGLGGGTIQRHYEDGTVGICEHGAQQHAKTPVCDGPIAGELPLAVVLQPLAGYDTRVLDIGVVLDGPVCAAADLAEALEHTVEGLAGDGFPDLHAVGLHLVGFVGPAV